MRAARLPILVILVATIAAAVMLSSMTFDRALVSTRATRELTIRLVDLDRGPGDGDYLAEISISNAGEVPGKVQFMRFSLSYSGELIATDQWHPEAFNLEPGEVVRLERDMVSPLDPASLPDPDTVDPDEWSIRVHFRISHPMSREPIMLNRYSGLAREGSRNE